MRVATAEWGAGRPGADDRSDAPGEARYGAEPVPGVKHADASASATIVAAVASIFILGSLTPRPRLGSEIWIRRTDVGTRKLRTGSHLPAGAYVGGPGRIPQGGRRRAEGGSKRKKNKNECR